METKQFKNKYVKGRDGIFMDKIELKKENVIKDITVKFGKQKVNIKPFIDVDNVLDITEIVLNNYYKQKDVETRLLSSNIIEYSYILALAKVMTNVNCEDVNLLINTGFATLLKDNIYNYNDILKGVYFSIEQNNMHNEIKSLMDLLYDVVDSISESLDNADKKLNNNTKELNVALDEFKELKEVETTKVKEKDMISNTKETIKKKTKKVTKK